MNRPKPGAPRVPAHWSALTDAAIPDAVSGAVLVEGDVDAVAVAPSPALETISERRGSGGMSSMATPQHSDDHNDCGGGGGSSSGHNPSAPALAREESAFYGMREEGAVDSARTTGESNSSHRSHEPPPPHAASVVGGSVTSLPAPQQHPPNKQQHFHAVPPRPPHHAQEPAASHHTHTTAAPPTLVGMFTNHHRQQQQQHQLQQHSDPAALTHTAPANSTGVNGSSSSLIAAVNAPVATLGGSSSSHQRLLRQAHASLSVRSTASTTSNGSNHSSSANTKRRLVLNSFNLLQNQHRYAAAPLSLAGVGVGGLRGGVTSAAVVPIVVGPTTASAIAKPTTSPPLPVPAPAPQPTQTASTTTTASRLHASHSAPPPVPLANVTVSSSACAPPVSAAPTGPLTCTALHGACPVDSLDDITALIRDLTTSRPQTRSSSTGGGSGAGAMAGGSVVDSGAGGGAWGSGSGASLQTSTGPSPPPVVSPTGISAVEGGFTSTSFSPNSMNGNGTLHLAGRESGVDGSSGGGGVDTTTPLATTTSAATTATNTTTTTTTNTTEITGSDREASSPPSGTTSHSEPVRAAPHRQKATTLPTHLDPTDRLSAVGGKEQAALGDDATDPKLIAENASFAFPTIDSASGSLGTRDSHCTSTSALCSPIGSGIRPPTPPLQTQTRKGSRQEGDCGTNVQREAPQSGGSSPPVLDQRPILLRQATMAPSIVAAATVAEEHRSLPATATATTSNAPVTIVKTTRRVLPVAQTGLPHDGKRLGIGGGVGAADGAAAGGGSVTPAALRSTSATPDLLNATLDDGAGTNATATSAVVAALEASALAARRMISDDGAGNVEGGTGHDDIDGGEGRDPFHSPTAADRRPSRFFASSSSPHQRSPSGIESPVAARRSFDTSLDQRDLLSNVSAHSLPLPPPHHHHHGHPHNGLHRHLHDDEASAEGAGSEGRPLHHLLTDAHLSTLGVATSSSEAGGPLSSHHADPDNDPLYPSRSPTSSAVLSSPDVSDNDDVAPTITEGSVIGTAHGGARATPTGDEGDDGMDPDGEGSFRRSPTEQEGLRVHWRAPGTAEASAAPQMPFFPSTTGKGHGPKQQPTTVATSATADEMNEGAREYNEDNDEDDDGGGHSIATVSMTAESSRQGARSQRPTLGDDDDYDQSSPDQRRLSLSATRQRRMSADCHVATLSALPTRLPADTASMDDADSVTPHVLTGFSEEEGAQQPAEFFHDFASVSVIADTSIMAADRTSVVLSLASRDGDEDNDLNDDDDDNGTTSARIDSPAALDGGRDSLTTPVEASPLHRLATEGPPPLPPHRALRPVESLSHRRNGDAAAANAPERPSGDAPLTTTPPDDNNTTTDPDSGVEMLSLPSPAAEPTELLLGEDPLFHEVQDSYAVLSPHRAAAVEHQWRLFAPFVFPYEHNRTEYRGYERPVFVEIHPALWRRLVQTANIRHALDLLLLMGFVPAADDDAEAWAVPNRQHPIRFRFIVHDVGTKQVIFDDAIPDPHRSRIRELEHEVRNLTRQLRTLHHREHIAQAIEGAIKDAAATKDAAVSNGSPLSASSPTHNGGGGGSSVASSSRAVRWSTQSVFSGAGGSGGGGGGGGAGGTARDGFSDGGDSSSVLYDTSAIVTIDGRGSATSATASTATTLFAGTEIGLRSADAMSSASSYSRRSSHHRAQTQPQPSQQQRPLSNRRHSSGSSKQHATRRWAAAADIDDRASSAAVSEASSVVSHSVGSQLSRSSVAGSSSWAGSSAPQPPHHLTAEPVITNRSAIVASTERDTIIRLKVSYLDPDAAPFAVCLVRNAADRLVIPCAVVEGRFLVFVAKPQPAGSVSLCVVCGGGGAENAPSPTFIRYTRSVWMEFSRRAAPPPPPPTSVAPAKKKSSSSSSRLDLASQQQKSATDRKVGSSVEVGQPPAAASAAPHSKAALLAEMSAATVITPLSRHAVNQLTSAIIPPASTTLPDASEKSMLASTCTGHGLLDHDDDDDTVRLAMDDEGGDEDDTTLGEDGGEAGMAGRNLEERSVVPAREGGMDAHSPPAAAAAQRAKGWRPVASVERHKGVLPTEPPSSEPVALTRAALDRLAGKAPSASSIRDKSVSK